MYEWCCINQACLAFRCLLEGFVRKVFVLSVSSSVGTSYLWRISSDSRDGSDTMFCSIALFWDQRNSIKRSCTAGHWCQCWCKTCTLSCNCSSRESSAQTTSRSCLLVTRRNFFLKLKDWRAHMASYNEDESQEISKIFSSVCTNKSGISMQNSIHAVQFYSVTTEVYGHFFK